MSFAERCKLSQAGISLGNRILAPVIAIILLLIGLETWRCWHDALKEKELLVADISKGHDRLAKEADAIAKENLQIALSLAFIDGVQESIGLEDRERLMGIVAPIIKSLQNHADRDIKVHFHVPPGKSFLRLWKPQKFGDDISSFRQTVVDVLQKGKPVYGIEAGRAGLAIRGVAPIFWGGSKTPVGSVEVLSSLNAVADAISRTSGESNAILGLMRVKDTASAYQSKGNVGRFTVLKPFPPGVAKGMVDETMLEKALKDFVAQEKGNTLVTASFLKDYRGDPIGVYVRFVDISAINSRIQSFLSALSSSLFSVWP